jgi:hypothetical protein
MQAQQENRSGATRKDEVQPEKKSGATRENDSVKTIKMSLIHVAARATLGKVEGNY